MFQNKKITKIKSTQFSGCGFVVFLCVVLLSPGKIFGIPIIEECGLVTCNSGSKPIMDINCMESSPVVCYGGGNRQIANCVVCESGYELIYNFVDFGGCTYPIAECQKSTTSCSGCINCASDTTWTSKSVGYLKKSTKICNCNTCSIASTKYRCAAGFYGTTTDGATGCKACPNFGTSNPNINGDTALNTIMANCYISDQTGADTTGSFDYTGLCYL